MSERFKSILIVTVVALLIWLYAEQANPAKPLSRAVTFQLRLPEGSDLIARLGEPNRAYQFEFSGPLAELETLRQRLQRTADKVTLAIGTDIDPGTGQREYLARELLAGHEWFEGSKVIISEAQTQSVRVVIDRWTRVDVAVAAGDFGDLAIDGPVLIEPASLAVEVWESIERPLAADQLRLVAVPASSDLDHLAEGQSHTLAARVEVNTILRPEQVRLPEGSRVNLTFRLKSRQAQTAFGPVPIKLVILPRDQQYEVTLTEPVIAEVRLTGPSDLINRVKAREIKVFGYLDLDSVELSSGITSKAVSFDHLAGLTVSSGPHVAQFTITRRPDMEP